jgi:hypothetical protein
MYGGMCAEVFDTVYSNVHCIVSIRVINISVEYGFNAVSLSSSVSKLLLLYYHNLRFACVASSCCCLCFT